MKIVNYLASLLPSFAKDQVLEDCRITRSEIETVTLPAYTAAVDLFKSYKPKSPMLANNMATFSREVKGGSNFVVAVEKGLRIVLENLDAVQDLVQRTYNEEVAGQGFTYLKANLLQLVECVSFVSLFARRYLLFIYTCEAVEGGGLDSVGASMTPAQVDWLNQNFVSFCTALNAVTTPPAQVQKMLREIPDVLVTSENVHTLGATIGNHKVDPFSMGLIPVALNPIYHIGMAVAEWQAARYKTAQEELKLLQLRRLHLERLNAGKTDARLESEIAYLERRIQGYNYKLEQMEKKYG